MWSQYSSRITSGPNYNSSRKSVNSRKRRNYNNNDYDNRVKHGRGFDSDFSNNSRRIANNNGQKPQQDLGRHGTESDNMEWYNTYQEYYASQSIANPENVFQETELPSPTEEEKNNTNSSLSGCPKNWTSPFTELHSVSLFSKANGHEDKGRSASNSSIERQLLEKSERIKSLELLTEAIQSENSKLQAKLYELSIENTDLSIRLAQKPEQCKSCEELLIENDLMKKRETETAKSIENLEMENKHLKSTVEDLSSRLKLQRSSIVDTKTKKIADLNKKVIDLTALNQELTNSKNMLENELLNVKFSFAEKENEVKSIKNRLQDNKESLKNVEKAKEVEQTKLRQDLNIKSEIIDALRNSLDEDKRRQESIISDCQDEIRLLRDEIERNNSYGDLALGLGEKLAESDKLIAEKELTYNAIIEELKLQVANHILNSDLQSKDASDLKRSLENCEQEACEGVRKYEDQITDLKLQIDSLTISADRHREADSELRQTIADFEKLISDQELKYNVEISVLKLQIESITKTGDLQGQEMCELRKTLEERDKLVAERALKYDAEISGLKEQLDIQIKESDGWANVANSIMEENAVANSEIANLNENVIKLEQTLQQQSKQSQQNYDQKVREINDLQIKREHEANELKKLNSLKTELNNRLIELESTNSNLLAELELLKLEQSKGASTKVSDCPDSVQISIISSLTAQVSDLLIRLDVESKKLAESRHEIDSLKTLLAEKSQKILQTDSLRCEAAAESRTSHEKIVYLDKQNADLVDQVHTLKILLNHAEKRLTEKLVEVESLKLNQRNHSVFNEDTSTQTADFVESTTDYDTSNSCNLQSSLDEIAQLMRPEHGVKRELL